MLFGSSPGLGLDLLHSTEAVSPEISEADLPQCVSRLDHDDMLVGRAVRQTDLYRGLGFATDGSRAVPLNFSVRVVAAEIDPLSADSRTRVAGCAPVAMLGVNKSRKANRQAMTHAYRPIPLGIDLRCMPAVWAILAEVSGNSRRCDPGLWCSNETTLRPNDLKFWSAATLSTISR